MSAIELRAQVHQHIDELDEAFLKVIYAMLETYQQQQQADPIIGFDVDGKPKRASIMKMELKKEVEEAKKGNYTTIEDLKKESKQWLKTTK